MSKGMLAKFFIGVGLGFALYYVLKLAGVL
jgi:hypothetical protein